jgi:hypothetical protein
MLAVAVLIATGCGGRAPSPGEEAPGPRQLQGRQVIVTLASTAPEHWARITEDLAIVHDLPRVGAFPLASLAVQCVVFQIPDDRQVEDVVRRLAVDPRVESVQPNQAFEGLAAPPTDPYAPLQHGARAIRAHLAHRWATGKGVRVGVVDTGVEIDHPDLRGRVVETANFVERGEHTFSRDRHGTAVAGVIAARANNDVGIFGIAPDAAIVALKACWHRASGTGPALCSSWTLARAVDFAIGSRVNILNFSLAGPPDPLLARLIARAREHGITAVAAVLEAGALAPGFPASLAGVIPILASDPEGHVRARGRLRDVAALAAPGIDILTTTPGQSYDFLSGSSLAVAHVSGILALLLERDPSLSPARLDALLRSTARSVDVTGESSGAGVGLVDACSAVGGLLARPACD